MKMKAGIKLFTLQNLRQGKILYAERRKTGYPCEMQQGCLFLKVL